MANAGLQHGRPSPDVLSVNGYKEGQHMDSLSDSDPKHQFNKAYTSGVAENYNWGLYREAELEG